MKYMVLEEPESSYIEVEDTAVAIVNLKAVQ